MTGADIGAGVCPDEGGGTDTGVEDVPAGTFTESGGREADIPDTIDEFGAATGTAEEVVPGLGPPFERTGAEGEAIGIG